MFPAVAPARMRETKRSGRRWMLLATAKRTIDAALPPSDVRITRLRPKRSDMRPRIGVATSCVSENIEKRKPTVSAEPPIDSTYSGRNGMTIPKPTRSRNTVTKTMTTTRVSRGSRAKGSGGPVTGEGGDRARGASRSRGPQRGALAQTDWDDHCEANVTAAE